MTVNDLTFDVRVAGPDRGPWVLLLHGFPVNGSCYDDVLPRLHESGLRTIVLDQRGYSPGARPSGVQDYRLDLLVSDAIGVLDALGVSYAILVGHDWGGIVAWHLAGKYPDRFTGLVVASTGHPSALREALSSGDQRERSSYILDFVAEGAEEKILADDGAGLRAVGVTAEEMAPLIEPGALTAALNWYRANFVGDIKATMACPPVEIPTTMVWSDADPALGREQAQGSGRYVYSDWRFCELAGVDHWIPQHAAPALASEIALRSTVF
ncbi:alpha/beta hydrolase [Gordonia sp. zg691]|uniref:Alpha/beta hydrolase n=1 Tax=Gordonia jinghuaiqii TaxID=2758710 RepID=A0A7D7LX80_9ACTN|nr:alpha/beta hydrolase [Gordonia jinghuaiqii]MBD0861280.1 alpha/beta hydrolase [Gordonia jinghuaiqii]MCR5976187.1 alpha/beta fold hydrolase [Gordonia jinghuaiqii]QMT03841.1 alpha/beta hydrolase [Gordonia jinghuaiqii]